MTQQLSLSRQPITIVNLFMLPNNVTKVTLEIIIFSLEIPVKTRVHRVVLSYIKG